MNHDEEIIFLTNRLDKANALLRSILPTVNSDGFNDSAIRDAVIEAEAWSYYKKHTFRGLSHDELLQKAKEAAMRMANDRNTCCVVVETDTDILVMSKKRIEANGVSKSDVVFDTEKP